MVEDGDAEEFGEEDLPGVDQPFESQRPKKNGKEIGDGPKNSPDRFNIS
jgi:hypothetical protein